MIPMDLKGLARFLIIVGFILAVAVFQNQILPPWLTGRGTYSPPTPPTPSAKEAAAAESEPGTPAEKLLARIAELEALIEKLLARIADLEALIEGLLARIAELEAREREVSEREVSLQAWQASVAEESRRVETLYRWCIGLFTALGVILLISMAVVLDRQRAARVSQERL